MISKRTKFVGGVALAFFGISIIAFWGLLYLILSYETKLAEGQEQIQKATVHKQEIASLDRLIEETVSEREEISSYILHDDDDVIRFLSLIETLGNEQGVELKTTSLNAESAGDLFENLAINISVTGSYRSIQHLLMLFETLPFQSSVSRLSLTRASETGVNGAWDGKLTLNVTKYVEP